MPGMPFRPFPASPLSHLTRIRRRLRLARQSEDGLFLLLLGGLTVLGLWPILARNTGLPPFNGGELINRHLLLWLTLAGALAAVRGHAHITVDVAGPYLPRRSRAWLHAVTGVITGLACLLFAWLAGRFSAGEWSSAQALVEKSTLILLPAAFWVLAPRFFFQAWRDLRHAWWRPPPRPAPGRPAHPAGLAP